MGGKFIGQTGNRKQEIEGIIITSPSSIQTTEEGRAPTLSNRGGEILGSNHWVIT